MQAEDRPIHFSTELLHAPKPRDKAALQELYADLAKTRDAAYDNTDFTNPQAPRFFTKRGKAQSVLLFLPDRIAIVEEWVDTTFSQFLEKVAVLGPKLLAVTGVPFFGAQAATVRTTFALTNYEDAREFILEQVCHQDESLAYHMERPIQIGGMRLVFPQTEEHPGDLNVTIESYRRSPQEVYVEVKGIFNKTKINADEFSTAQDNLRTVRSFATDNVFPFLNQYDVLPEEDH